MDVNKYTEKIFSEILEETPKYSLVSSEKMESREQKIKVMSLYGTNLWLLNNGEEINNSDELRRKIDCFSEIINNPMMTFACRKAHLSSTVNDYINGEVTVDEVIPVFLNNGVTFSDKLDFVKLSNGSYKSAIDSMRSLKKDPLVKQKAKICHYQFYSDDKLEQMGSTELYVLLSANGMVLSKLNEIYNDMVLANKNKSTSLKRR